MASSAGAGSGRFGRRMAQAMLVAAALAVSACSPIYRNHGYVPSEPELATVEVGRDTRETVSQKIGRPSAQGLLNDTGWFYVQSRWKHSGGRAPDEVERQVLAVTFNDRGTVQNIARYGLEDGRVIVLSRRVTESNIKGITFISQLLGNIGQLRATDILE